MSPAHEAGLLLLESVLDTATVGNDYLEGAEQIADFLGKENWSERKVRHARDVGTLPIRKKKGIGLYAFKTELLAALRGADSLPATKN